MKCQILYEEKHSNKKKIEMLINCLRFTFYMICYVSTVAKILGWSLVANLFI